MWLRENKVGWENLRQLVGPITCQRICILLYKSLVSTLYWFHTSLVKKISTCHKYMTIDLFLIISRYYVVKHTQTQKWKIKMNVAKYKGKMCFILIDLIHLYSGWKSLAVERHWGYLRVRMSFSARSCFWVVGMAAPGSGCKISITRLYIADLMRRNENSN